MAEDPLVDSCEMLDEERTTLREEGGEGGGIKMHLKTGGEGWRR